MDEQDEQLAGDRRLRGSGVGSILAGICLALLSVVLSFAQASGAILAVGVLGWYGERKRGDVTGVGIGVVAVGAIGLLEALFEIAGLDVLVFAALAAGAGLLDVVLGNFFGQVRDRHR